MKLSSSAGIWAWHRPEAGAVYAELTLLPSVQVSWPPLQSAFDWEGRAIHLLPISHCHESLNICCLCMVRAWSLHCACYAAICTAGAV